MTRSMRYPAAGLLAVLTLLLSLPIALAHEGRDVGKYRLTVGWSSEPAYQGQRNGVSLVIVTKDTAQPVEGAEKTLKAELLFGGQRREVALRAVFRQPGQYTADVIPTRDGDYRFRFFGEIEGQKVDEVFDSADGKFDGVQKTDALYFPGGDTSAQLAQTVQAAEQKASQGQTLGLAGLALGALGLVAGGLALVNSRRKAV